MSTLHDTGAFTVVAVPGAGMGMIASRDLFKGSVVLRERPIAILRAATLQEAAAELWPELSKLRKEWHANRSWPDEVHAPPEVIERFAEKEFNRCSRHDQQRWLSLADAFHASTTPGGVARTNAFTDVATGDQHLFERMSRANHSCDPNMRFLLDNFPGDGGLVSLSVLRDTLKGEALTISYISLHDLELTTEERRALLREKFNFECECKRCGPAAVRAAAMATAEAAPSPVQVLEEEVTSSHRATELAMLESARATISQQLRACSAMLHDPSRGAGADPTLLRSIKACADALTATERARRAFLM